MLEGLRPELRYPGQVPAIPSDQVVQIFCCRPTEFVVVLEAIGNDQLQRLIACYTIGAQM
jgi:hypothetical protein